MPRRLIERPCDCSLCKCLLEPVPYRRIIRPRFQYGTSNPVHSPPSSPAEIPECDVDEIESVSLHRQAEQNLENEWLNSDSNASNPRFKLEVDSTESSGAQVTEFSSVPSLNEGLSDADDSNSDVNLEDSASDSDESVAEQNDSSGWCFEYDTKCYEELEVSKMKVPNSHISLLSWLCLQIHLLVSHPSMSKSAFTHSLQIQKLIHKDIDNVLPSTYTEVRKLIDPFILKKKVFDVCPNECVIFRDCTRHAYSNLDKCPVCGEERYFNSSSNRRIPRRKFIYIPVGPRLSRIYGNVNLCQLVQSHPGGQYTGEDMWDVHGSPVWQEIYSDDGYFQGDKKGISFALELDGVNPFHNVGVQYSMTPIMMTILNLPRHVRNAFGNINLIGIIPGKGRAESSEVNVYLEILVDELLFLSQCTMTSYDMAPIAVKIKLLMYVLDYPGLSKVFHQHGSGSLSGCHWCHVLGKRCEHLEKVIYLSNRRYLERADPLRKDTRHFSLKKVEEAERPALRTLDSEMQYRKAFENSKNKTQASVVAAATGCKKSYVLSNLPGHNRLTESQPDACHTIKDVIQNIMNIVSGSKVNLSKVVSAEEKLGRAHLLYRAVEELNDRSLHSKKRRLSIPGDEMALEGRTDKKRLPFSLTKEELLTADRRAESVRVPVGFGLKPSPFISKTGSLKSHDWKQLATQGVLKYCLRNTLGEECRKTLFFLLDCLAELCQEKISMDTIDDIEVKLNKALALLEMNFPLHLQNITTHLLHHIPDSLRRVGPVYSSWMFVFERFNSWICKRVLNMRYPEATVIETFLLHDWCHYMFQTGRVSLDLQAVQVPTVSSKEYDSEELDDEDLHQSNHLKANDKPTTTVKKRHLMSIHRLINNPQCEKCTLTRYYSHREKHPITCRVTTYTSETKESSAARTLSSFTFVEMDRGSPNQKLCSKKYVHFGRIQYFIEHIDSSEVKTTCAFIKWFDDVVFDDESGLWWVDKETVSKRSSFALTNKLSPPLVTAVEDDKLWFLNSGRKHILSIL